MLSTWEVIGRLVLGLDLLETCGAICGAMTSTPGLGAVASRTDSPRPTTSYAAAYPLALVIVTLLAPLLAQHLA